MLDETVSTALARCGMAHRARASQLLAEIDLHPGQEFLLAALHRLGPSPIGVVADELGVEQPTVTKMTARMERGGLVSRDLDPGDRRRTVVSLTRAGRRRHGEARRAWARLDADTTAPLSASEADTLRRLLTRVRTSLLEGDGG